MRKIIHPLWIHLPAVGLLAYALLKVVEAWPLPDRVPLHFSWSGDPNRWGQPWEGLAISFGIMSGFIALTVFLSEIWARQETRKAFNWFALLDEAIVGPLSITAVHWLEVARGSQPVWNTPWITIAAVMAGAILAAATLEWLRPFRPFPHTVHAEDTGTLEAMVASRVRKGQPWTYWEAQNPRYVSILSLVLLVGMTTASLATLWATSSWLPGVLILIPALAGLLVYGGLRIQVARGQLILRLGLLGVRLLRVPLGEIASVHVQTFSPLREFGGWGPGRFGRPEWAASGPERRGVLAFYFRGTEGAKVVRKDGRTYLIGSDHPERLCAVLRAAAGLPSSNA